MPNNWKKYKLGELLEYQKGFAFKSKWYQNFGVNVVRVSDTTENSIDISTCNKIDEKLTDELQKFKLKHNDIIIATVGSWPPNYASVVGKVVKVPMSADGAFLNQNAVRLRASNDELFNQAFIYYLMKSNRFLNYIVNSAQGSASQASIKLTDIFNFDISIPEIHEQRAIASILSALDNKIELNLQTNKTLEEMAMTLYKHWFVDFGPFQNGEFVDSELGKIPKGWEVKSIGDLVKDKIIEAPKDGNHGGIHPKGKDFKERGVPFITASNLKTGNIDFETCSHISFEQAKTLKKGFSIEGDVLLSHKATIGRVCTVPKLNTDYIILTPQVTYYRILNKIKLTSNFLEYTFKSNRFQNDFNMRAQSGSTRAYLSITNQWDLKILFPNINVIKKYTEEVEKFTDLQSVNRANNQTLTKLRDTLLPKLISGEVKVKDIEQTIATAL